MLLTFLALPLTTAFAQSQPAPTTATAPDSAAYQQFVFAYRLLQRNEDKLATDAFDEYLRRYPQDERRGDATYYRALLARRAGDNETAAKLLATCPPPKLLPPNDVPLLHAQVYCDLGKFDPALAVLERVNIATADAATKASILYLTGVAYRGSGNLPGAVQSFDAAGAIDSPLRARSLLEEARLDAQMDKPADAVSVLQRCLPLKDAQVQPAAALLAGDEAYRLGQYAQAVEFYKVVITTHQTSPQFGPAVIGTLWAQLAAKQYDAVLKTCQDVRPALSAGDGFVADFLAGTALEDMGKYDEAIKRFDALLATAPAPDQPRDKVAYNLAFSQYQLGHYDDMAHTLSSFAATYARSPLIPDAEYLQALGDVKRGDAAAGAARLTAIIAQGEKTPYQARALLDRAKLYESTNQTSPAVDDYRQFLAAAGRAKPPMELALVAEGMLRLTDLLMRLGQYGEAEKTASALLARPGIDPLTEQDALYRQGVALVKQQKLEPALASFQTLMTRHPQNRYLAECHYYRGLLLAGMGHPDDATADLLAAAQSNLPTALKAQALRVASIHLREKNDARAKDVLLQLAALVTIPSLKPDEMIWLGRRLDQEHQPLEAMKYLAPLLDAKSPPGTPGTAPVATAAAPGPAVAEATFVAGLCLRDAQEFEGSLAAFRRVVSLNHGFELEARLEIGRTLAAAGQTDAALSEYGGLISAESSAIASAAIYESAQIHRQRAHQRQLANEPDAARHELTEAHKLFKRLVLLFPFPQLSPVPELSYLELAEIETELGQPDNATAELKELGDRFPDGPYASYARAVLLQQQNKKGEAVFLLKKLHEQTLDPRLASRVDHRLQGLEATP